MRYLRAVILVSIASFSSLQASTFVVPDDGTLFLNADAVVLASPLSSYSRATTAGSIETVTTFAIEEQLSGAIDGASFDLLEPGGVLPDRQVVISGVPRFEDGRRYLLFLINDQQRWHVRDMIVGKFSFATDEAGVELLIRDEDELTGFNPDGTTHLEPRRSANGFLRFLRQQTFRGRSDPPYFVPKRPLLVSGPNATRGPRLATNNLASNIAPYTATSYTFTISGALGGRWNVFPSAVPFYSIGSEPGAPGGGITAINAALAAWNNDPNSNVNYTNAGADTSGTHTLGLGGSDNENTISFERNLTAYGAPAFTCSASGYSGTLGIGGITRASGTHTGPNGELFATTLEGDVEMNQGLANCTLLFNNGDFNTAVTHEIGHTLGFRHSDQTRADNPSIACTTDPSLECSSAAVMKAFIVTGVNAALQPWDQHAVAAVYPGPAGGTVLLAAPTGVNARAITSTQVLVTWNASTGATSYKIYRRGPNAPFAVIGTTTSNSFTDNGVVASSAYLYLVHAVNATTESGDSAADLATTILFTDDPLSSGTVVKAVHLAELRTAVNAVRALAGLTAAAFTDNAVSGVTIKAVHITELRTALDQALNTLGLPSGGYTDSIVPGTQIRAIHFQELRNRVK